MKRGYLMAVCTALGIVIGVIADQLIWGLLSGNLIGIMLEAGIKKKS